LAAVFNLAVEAEAVAKLRPRFSGQRRRWAHLHRMSAAALSRRMSAAEPSRHMSDDRPTLRDSTALQRSTARSSARNVCTG
jgi:hypothetical protein